MKIGSLIIAIMITVAHISCIKANADDCGLIKGYATAYCLDGVTATGKHTREGICATGNPEWIGMTAVIYQRLPDNKVGEIIGIYEIEDTGCKPTVMDIWEPDLDRCQEFMNRVYEDGCEGKVWIQIIDAEG